MAVSFNGTSDAYAMGNVENIASKAPMSLMCWVNFPAFPQGPQTFLSKGFNGTLTAYQFQQVTGLNIVWSSFNGSSPGTTWNISWGNANAWHHIYGDYDGAHWHFYSDGVLVATTTDAIVGPQLTSNQFVIGAIDVNGTIGQFSALCMADAAVFNGPLTSTEITNLANGTLRPSAGMSQTLLGYWPLNVGGATTPDMSGNGNNGTAVTSSPTTCATGPVFVTPFLPGHASIIPFWSDDP
jgi:Concanavalin A-like lectin/glucanases superfamily